MNRTGWVDRVRMEAQVKAGSKEISIEAKFLAKKRAWAKKPDILRTVHRIYLGDAREMTQLGSSPLVHRECCHGGRR